MRLASNGGEPKKCARAGDESGKTSDSLILVEIHARRSRVVPDLVHHERQRATCPKSVSFLEAVRLQACAPSTAKIGLCCVCESHRSAAAVGACWAECARVPGFLRFLLTRCARRREPRPGTATTGRTIHTRTKLCQKRASGLCAFIYTKKTARRFPLGATVRRRRAGELACKAQRAGGGAEHGWSHARVACVVVCLMCRPFTLVLSRCHAAGGQTTTRVTVRNLRSLSEQ